MRVIAGSAGGITLRIPKTELRPTMDLVRGAIFSSLGEAVSGASVLDLFAGTGSIGIEALSRGAASATLVEADRKACSVIAENLDRTQLRARVVCNDVFRFLESKLSHDPVDLVFADPPYSKKTGDRDFSLELLRNPNLPLLLRDGGLFVLEVAQKWLFPEDAGWSCLRRKRYGSTETLFLIHNHAARGHPLGEKAPGDGGQSLESA
jgi:16S rRNA (guanine966-N2)-methyltransferase